MINAIRLEHPTDGKGIFSHKEDGKDNTVYEFAPKVGTRHSKFNSLVEDMPNWSKLHFCAYKNLEQLNEWIFPDEMTEIINKGFKVYLLDLSEATVTDYQVIFKKEHILQQKDITSIFAQKK